jgi:hypothetical protein
MERVLDISRGFDFYRPLHLWIYGSPVKSVRGGYADPTFRQHAELDVHFHMLFPDGVYDVGPSPAQTPERIVIPPQAIVPTTQSATVPGRFTVDRTWL